MIDVIGGHTNAAFATIPTATPQVRSGKLQGAWRRRQPSASAALPDVPTAAEAGLPGYDVANWVGIVAPAGTPAAIVEKLNKEIAAIRIAGVQKQLANRGRGDVSMSSGRVRRLHGEGIGQMGTRREGGRHQGAMIDARIDAGRDQIGNRRSASHAEDPLAAAEDCRPPAGADHGRRRAGLSDQAGAASSCRSRPAASTTSSGAWSPPAQQAAGQAVHGRQPRRRRRRRRHRARVANAPKDGYTLLVVSLAHRRQSLALRPALRPDQSPSRRSRIAGHRRRT